MKNIYYPVKLVKEETGSVAYTVVVPDIDGCVTQGHDLDEAYYMAFDAIGSMLSCMEQSGDEIPLPSNPKEIQLEENEVLMIVRFNMLEFKQKTGTQSVKKTLTIPSWLNQIALSRKVNFSKVLQEALIEELGLNDNDDL